MIALAPNVAVDERHMFFKELTLEALGEHVGGVVPRADLVHGQSFPVHFVLYPQVLDFNVSHFADTLPVDLAQRGCRSAWIVVSTSKSKSRMRLLGPFACVAVLTRA